MKEMHKLEIHGMRFTDELKKYIEDNYRYSVDGAVINKRGKTVGCYTGKYARVYTKYGTLSVSRLLWFLHYGEWPDKMVDHIDGDTHNNALKNLRLATRSENLRNRGSNSGSKSKYKGVYPINNKWAAKIAVDNEKTYLGCFDSEEEAAVAYNKYCKKVHGEFSQLNKVEGI